MFRKPKRSAKKAGLRATRKKVTSDDPNENNNDDDSEEDRDTTQEVQEALKRAKQEQNNSTKKKTLIARGKDEDDDDIDNNDVMHQYKDTSQVGNSRKSHQNMATSTTQHHPKSMETISKSQSLKDPTRNKFLAAPIRAPTNIRTTCQFDYQPNICKDYKQTGFCGFGDSCIYLHDRGNTLAGWELEKVWETTQQKKKEAQEQQLTQFMNKYNNNNNNNNKEGEGGEIATTSDAVTVTTDDGLPFACYLCRKAFDEPIVTQCGHYFCQSCLQDHFTNKGENGDNVMSDCGTTNNINQKCPICRHETHGVMNQPN